MFQSRQSGPTSSNICWMVQQTRGTFKGKCGMIREKTQLSNWRHSGEQWNVFFFLRLPNKKNPCLKVSVDYRKRCGAWCWWESKSSLTGNTRSSPLFTRLVSVNENAESWRDIQREDQWIWQKAKREWTKDCNASLSKTYTLLAKHLNIMHLKIKGTGCIMKNKEEGPFRDDRWRI